MDFKMPSVPHIMVEFHYDGDNDLAKELIAKFSEYEIYFNGVEGDTRTMVFLVPEGEEGFDALDEFEEFFEEVGKDAHLELMDGDKEELTESEESDLEEMNDIRERLSDAFTPATFVHETKELDKIEDTAKDAIRNPRIKESEYTVSRDDIKDHILDWFAEVSKKYTSSGDEIHREYFEHDADQWATDWVAEYLESKGVIVED